MAAPLPEFFRREARQNYAQGRSSSKVLQISPTWLDASSWLLLAVGAVAVAVLLLLTLDEYASGPAMVRLAERRDIVATDDGLIAAIYRKPGDRVGAGDVLARLDDTAQRRRLSMSTDEYEHELLRHLADPALQADSSWTSVVARQLSAIRELSECELRAPEAGVVSDVRIRAGQAVRRGEVVFSVVGTNATFNLVIVLPGRFRPLLRTGMEVRFEVAGFPYSHQRLQVQDLGDEIVGPAEVRRFLGPESADALDLSGPSVILTARLPTAGFRSDGTTFNYFDGMHGRAEVRLRRKPLWAILLPGAREIGPR